MSNNVVTRVAPSPTGQMHIGTVRTALFNYIFAKQNGGTYLVRIEDTDKERNREEWVDDIWQDFQWCALTPDKKYRQSEHVGRHKELLHSLVNSDKAYVSKEPKKDDASQTVEVVRLRNPGGKVTFTDLIRGEVTIDTTELGDFVIARSIDDPLYHFAVVADDGDAGVTHVIRGDDHISNTPRQILILEALGFQRPVYAHLPLILAPDRSKLSKRKHGASLENYRGQGFLPEAILNYLALLGWNPGTEKELFTLDELIKEFSLERVHKAGAVFDIEKMKWFNHEYTKMLSLEEYEKQLSVFIESRGETVPPYMPAICTELRNRAQTYGEAANFLIDGEFSFMEETIPTPTTDLLLKGAKASAEAVKTHLQAVLELLGNQEGFTADSVKELVFPYATEKGRASVLWPMRVALSGKEKSPDPFTLAGLLGKERTLERIEKAFQLL
ncbi:glutamate--tRNA ligase [Patescibacteria group bacterium]|nr:glutamate--tRNA ligase [Patescibacteria group bacterium]